MRLVCKGNLIYCGPDSVRPVQSTHSPCFCLPQDAQLHALLPAVHCSSGTAIPTGSRARRVPPQLGRMQLVPHSGKQARFAPERAACATLDRADRPAPVHQHRVELLQHPALLWMRPLLQQHSAWQKYSPRSPDELFCHVRERLLGSTALGQLYCSSSRAEDGAIRRGGYGR